MHVHGRMGGRADGRSYKWVERVGGQAGRQVGRQVGGCVDGGSICVFLLGKESFD